MCIYLFIYVCIVLIGRPAYVETNHRVGRLTYRDLESHLSDSLSMFEDGQCEKIPLVCIFVHHKASCALR